MKFTNRVYNVLKWIVMIVLPGFATFYGLLAETWGLPYVNEIIQTINAVTVFLGAMIGISTANHNNDICD